jgi:multiple sugar transport system ATP-binding protein
MNGGRVAQIGAPLDVYWNPADTFVARFLGSPPMNLFTTRVAADANGGRIESEAILAELTRWMPQTLAAVGARDVVLGVRAEDLHLDPAGAGPGGGSIKGRVFAVEPLGAETLLAVDTDAGECTARLPRDTRAEIGASVELFFGPEATYLFEATSTRAIPADSEPLLAGAGLTPIRAVQ